MFQVAINSNRHGHERSFQDRASLKYSYINTLGLFSERDMFPLPHPSGQFRNVQLFRTKFVNSSEVQQEYTFKTERQTKSSCSISVQKGFTLGGNLNLEFALPTENQPITEDVSSDLTTGATAPRCEAVDPKS